MVRVVLVRVEVGGVGMGGGGWWWLGWRVGAWTAGGLRDHLALRSKSIIKLFLTGTRG